MENQVLETISRIKHFSKKNPRAKNILNDMSKTSASNIDFSFIIETIKQLIAKNKIDNNFKTAEETENGNLSKSTNEVEKLRETVLEKTSENVNECLGELISKKYVKHNRINSRQCFSLPEDKTNHDDSNNHDDNIIDDNTIILDDICVLNEDFDSYQVKCMKKLQNVKDAFLRKTIRYGAKVRKKISEKKDMMRNMSDF